jgi:hypothetical protein
MTLGRNALLAAVPRTETQDECHWRRLRPPHSVETISVRDRVQLPGATRFRPASRLRIDAAESRKGFWAESEMGLAKEVEGVVQTEYLRHLRRCNGLSHQRHLQKLGRLSEHCALAIMR